jgi:hypothetical protein
MSPTCGSMLVPGGPSPQNSVYFGSPPEDRVILDNPVDVDIRRKERWFDVALDWQPGVTASCDYYEVREAT